MGRSITTAFAYVFGRRLVVALTGALSVPLLVRFLGAGEYGKYATVMAAFTLISVLATSSTNEGVRKYLAEERSVPDWKSKVFGYYLRLTLLAGVAAALLLASGTWTGLVNHLFGAEYSFYFYLAAILVFVRLFRGFIEKSLMGLQLESISEPLRVAYEVGFASGAVLLAYLGYGVAGVLFGNIIAATLVGAVGLMIIGSRLESWSEFLSPDSSVPRWELLRFNGYAVLFIFTLTSLYQVDIILLEIFTTSEQTGYYKAAIVLVQFIWLVPRAVQGVLVQSVSDLWNQQATQRITMLSTRATRYTLLLTGLLAIGLGVLADTFVPLYYGQEFAPAVGPILLLLPGTVGFAVARPLFSISQAKGKMEVVAACTGAVAVLNLALNLLLIPRYGMLGAATATSIGYGLLPLFHFAGARRLGYRPFEDARLVRIGVTIVFSGVCLYILTAFITAEWASLLIIPPVGFILYSIIAFAIGAISVDEVIEILHSSPLPINQESNIIRRWLGGD